MATSPPPSNLGPGFAWPLITLGDAYQPRPPIQWAVHGIFRRSSLNIVYGAPGCLKSFLLLDLCACVAAGKDWLEPLPGQSGHAVRTTQGTALYADFDNGAETTLDRLAAIGRAYKQSATTPLYMVSMPDPWLDLTDEGGPRSSPNRVDHAQRLANWIKGCNGTLAVLDNLGVISGDADENSGDMVRIMSRLRWVAQDTGATIIVVHHQRKGNGVKARAGDSLRGHSSIEAAIDLALLVERDADIVTVTATKTRSAEVRPFGARFTYQQQSGSNQLESARFFAARPATSDMRYLIEDAIIDVLSDNKQRNQSSLIAEVQQAVEASSNNNKRPGVKAVQNGIDTLVSRGTVARQPGLTNNAILYSLVITP